ncbi:MAG: CGNR zinc finger domain-containing protein [Candidatus Eremiobacteraeota bacterium]|nr:CGNR zinc finger domain-containing protein [Candidatus Eremiobacteraeota bacterium]
MTESAPGELEIIREFINAFEPENQDREKFADVTSAGQWLRERKLISQSITKAERARLETLREVFRTELSAHNGEGDPERSWAALGQFVKEAKLLVHIGSQPGQIRLIPAASGSVNSVTARLLAIMYDAIRLDQWRRLKACRKHSCLWAFYDRSKNGSRTWCDMAVCGNRVKAQRRRQRLSQ